MRHAIVQVSEYNAYEAIRAADIAIETTPKAAMMSSAKLCASEAHAAFNTGNFERARQRALDSLTYTVGVFAGAYQAAADRGPHR